MSLMDEGIIDIFIDESAFETASCEMIALKVRAEVLKEKLQKMYNELKAIQGVPIGKQLEGDLIKPVDNLLLVIGHISATLDNVVEAGHYKDIFDALGRDLPHNMPVRLFHTPTATVSYMRKNGKYCVGISNVGNMLF